MLEYSDYPAKRFRAHPITRISQNKLAMPGLSERQSTSVQVFGTGSDGTHASCFMHWRQHETYSEQSKVILRSVSVCIDHVLANGLILVYIVISSTPLKARVD